MSPDLIGGLPSAHDGGGCQPVSTGTPHGADVSLLPADVYLHYAYDPWTERGALCPRRQLNAHGVEPEHARQGIASGITLPEVARLAHAMP